MGMLVRPKEKRVAGVCAAVAAKLKCNVRWVRFVWSILSVVLLGAPVLFYLVLWLVTPSESKSKKSYEERMYERLNAGRRGGENKR